MSLPSLDQYRKLKQESCPTTRNKTAVYFGTAVPDTADVFGHSTPVPAVVDALMKAINKKTKQKKLHYHMPEHSQGKEKPNYSFKNFLVRAGKIADEIDDEIKDCKNKSDDNEDKIKDFDKEEDKFKQRAKARFTANVPLNPPKDKDDENDSEENKDGESEKPILKKDAANVNSKPQPKNEEYYWELYANTSFDQQ